VRHAGLRQHVAVEASEAAVAANVDTFSRLRVANRRRVFA
jgi:hypothetical protein